MAVPSVSPYGFPTKYGEGHWRRSSARFFAPTPAPKGKIKNGRGDPNKQQIKNK
jgi:hypothetical protein